MIFSELYSAYYNTIAAIISHIIEGERSEKELQKIVAERAFGESLLTIIPSLKGEKWQLVHADMTTSLEHKPTMPLTILQKQWLKALSLDPRVKLFGVEFPNLDAVEPLFTPADYHVYDKYSDGDPFEDEEYIRQFKVILDAIRQDTQIKFEMVNRNGKTMYIRCHPLRLEYSEKDDKFRLVTAGWHAVSTVNLSKIKNWLHFAHFEKQVEKIDNKNYKVVIKYDSDDEPEMVIRVLAFGPLVEVVEPLEFRELIKNKLKKQLSCEL